MKHFRIRHSLHQPSVGRYPQVKDAIGDFNVNSSTYIGNPKFYLNRIDIRPELPDLLLWASAKTTDLLSSSFLNENLILSEKLKKIVELYSTANFQFFKTNVFHKETINTDYYFMHPTKTQLKFLNFRESEVWELVGLKKNRIIPINSKDDFLKFAKNQKYPSGIRIEIIELKNEAPDLFCINYIHGGIGYFVSEKLKNEIESAGCTGIVFTEPNEKFP